MMETSSSTKNEYRNGRKRKRDSRVTYTRWKVALRCQSSFGIHFTSIRKLESSGYGSFISSDREGFFQVKIEAFHVKYLRPFVDFNFFFFFFFFFFY